MISVEHLTAEADALADRARNFWAVILHNYCNGARILATSDEDVGIPLCYTGMLRELPSQKTLTCIYHRYELTGRGRVAAFEQMMKARR
jgi:hypothetical protein